MARVAGSNLLYNRVVLLITWLLWQGSFMIYYHLLSVKFTFFSSSFHFVISFSFPSSLKELAYFIWSLSFRHFPLFMHLQVEVFGPSSRESASSLQRALLSSVDFILVYDFVIVFHYSILNKSFYFLFFHSSFCSRANIFLYYT